MHNTLTANTLTTFIHKKDSSRKLYIECDKFKRDNFWFVDITRQSHTVFNRSWKVPVEFYIRKKILEVINFFQ